MEAEQEVSRRFENIQQLIKDNIRLQIEYEGGANLKSGNIFAPLRLDDAQHANGCSMTPAQAEAANAKLAATVNELERCRTERDEAHAAQQQIQKHYDYYKRKYDQLTLGVDEGADLPLPLIVSPPAGAGGDSTTTKPMLSKIDYEVKLHKLSCELDVTQKRLKIEQEKRQQKEKCVNMKFSLKNRSV